MADKPMGIVVCTALYGIGGAFNILAGLLFLLGNTKAKYFIETEMEIDGTGLLSGIIGAAGFVILIGIILFAVSYGIWNLKKWARIAAIIFAIIELIDIPAGTIKGIVILYFLLLNQKTKNAFQ
ncbi:MAG: hypothetical protein CVT89_02100 [Candidatus Altiarchaeales archaeon HGW-Altiarchaeales-2]|nr:MAG: hypothetical protein CVT89_02100 [Candidatus Altiarchaeales archaeon HGW-Altiarchaeales-2]